MTARNPLVLIDGKLQELPAGDTVNGATGGGSAAPSPSRLLIYYGYPSSYKGIYNNASVIADIAANYDIWICGDTYDNPAHEDYANTQAIIAGVRAAGVKVFGYVPIGTNTENRSIATMQTSVDRWVTLNVDGIFLDEFGFDYQNTRTRQKTMVDYVHGKGLPVCANAWTYHDFACDNISELPWGSGDWRYVNFQTYNPTNIALTRWPTDCYLIENFCYDNTGPASRWDAQERFQMVTTLNATKNVTLWACAVLAETVGGTVDTTKTGNLTSMTDIMSYVSANAYLYGINTVGIGGFSFGAGGTPVVGQIANIASAATSAISENFTTGIFTRSFGDFTITVTNIDTAQYVDVTATPVLSDAPTSTPGATPPGGNSGEIQFNNGGSFGGATNVEINNGDLTLVSNPSPVTPPAGSVKIFGRTFGNARTMPAVVGPSGMDYALMPSMWRQKIGIWTPPGNATTVPGVFGTTAWTAVGTATARSVATTNLLTRMRRLGYVSAATAGSLASIRTAQAQYTTGNGSGLGGFFASFRFAITDAAAVSGARFFAGMSATTTAPTNVEPSTLKNCIGVAQLSTDATQLYLVYGGSAAQTAIALGTNFPPMAGTGIANGVAYDLTIWCPPNANGVVSWTLERIGTTFSVGGTIAPDTPGTQTPANTTLMNPVVWRCNNAQAAAVGFDMINFYIETDY